MTFTAVQLQVPRCHRWATVRQRVSATEELSTSFHIHLHHSQWRTQQRPAADAAGVFHGRSVMAASLTNTHVTHFTTPKPSALLRYPKVISYTKFEQFGIIRSWVMLQTHRQIQNILPTPICQSAFVITKINILKHKTIDLELHSTCKDFQIS